MSDLKILVQRFLDVCAGEENTRRRALMAEVERGELGPRIPSYFSVPFDWSIIRIHLWQALLQREINIPAVLAAREDYPVDLAEQVIAFQLHQRIFYIEQMPGDWPIEPTISTNLNLLWLNGDPGLNPIWTHVHCDLTTGDFRLEPFIRTPEDMQRFTPHPFRFDPALHERRVHLFRTLVGEGIAIQDDLEGHGYLNRLGSPFQELCRMHGTLETLMDMHAEPDAVHDMMALLTERAIARCDEMNAALGRRAFAPMIGGDEVNCDLFPPAYYDAFILPHERQCAAHGKNHYYHSCGNLTPIFDRIVALPNVKRIHVSPWSNLDVAVQTVGRKAILQKIVDTQKDILHQDDAAMRAQLNDFRTALTGVVGEVACHCETIGDFERSKAFIERARRILVR